MANSPETSRPGAAARQPSKSSPQASARSPAATDPKSKPADADAAKHAGHTAAEHEKMKGRS